jgi:putative colanic acid biosynthesis UDP-glucose lipid carrier transferase
MLSNPFIDLTDMLQKPGPSLSTTSLHTSAKEFFARNLPADKAGWQNIHTNGILRSFVASRKKYLLFKRLFDILFSLMIIVLLLSWMIPILSIMIAIDSRGPVFFRQKRVGKKGKIFYCLKFRTMVPNEFADEQPAEETDERITKLGRILRRINVDELPQFLNILMGDMSVVGPRPHMISDCIRYSFVIPSYQFRSMMRPGLTGWAQVNGFHGVVKDYENIIIRYYWDAQYVRKAGWFLDLKIITNTIRKAGKNIITIFSQPAKSAFLSEP